MTDAHAPPAEPVPPIVVGDHVATSLACAECHYDLRTLPAAGRCPECNLPVSESIRAVGGWTIERLRALRAVIVALAAASVFWVIPVLLVLLTEAGPVVRTLFVLCVIGMVPAIATAGLLGVHIGSRRRREARARLLTLIIAIALLPVLGLISIIITRSGGNELTITICLSVSIAARGVLCAAALGSLAFAARALHLRRDRFLHAAAIAIAVSTALSIFLVVGMTMRFSLLNMERALGVAEAVSATIICTATIVSAGLWQAITAREHGPRS